MDEKKKLRYLFRRQELRKTFALFEAMGYGFEISYQKEPLYQSQTRTSKLLSTHLRLLGSIDAVMIVYGESETFGQEIAHIIKAMLQAGSNLIDILETIARQWKVINFHTHITQNLGYFNSIEETCNFILNDLVSIVQVQRASILIEDDGAFLIAASIGLPEHIVKLRHLPISGISGWTFNQGQTLIINSDRDLPEEIQEQLITRVENRHSFKEKFISEPIIVVPLEVQHKIVGVLNLTNKKDATPFTSEDLKIITSIATEIAIMIKSSKLIEALKESEKLKMEITLAEQIQKSILPTSFPEIAPYTLYGKSVAPNKVGGDYFGYELNDRFLYMIIADVSGHSFSSALLVNNFRSYLKALLFRDHNLEDLVSEINRFICDDVGDSGRFLTMVIVRFERATGLFHYVNAGHNPPLCLLKDGTTRPFKVSGTPLGFFEHMEYQVFESKLNPGDFLFLYTDGLEEAESPRGIFFGKERLKELLELMQGEPVEQIIENVFQQVILFSGHQIQDDLTAMGLYYVE